MKKNLLSITLLLVSLSYAELFNANPNPFSEPWWVGGVSEPTPEQMEKINALPRLILPEKYKMRKAPLPSSIDNSLLQYFRPVFNQAGGSCGQASGVGYNFTYEINMERGTAATVTQNQFPTHHTYNFLNDGNGNNGSWYFDGWEIIKANGVPNVATYGGMWPVSSTYRSRLWLDGFSLWEAGMNNRVKEQFVIPVGTPEGLETLKQYFNDYCEGLPEGGIVNFTAGAVGTWQFDSLAIGTPRSGEYVVKLWHTELNHSMTLVGYDDSIRVDYNGDGKYTNNIDITGDSIIDMKDWEIGGLRMVNSWGTSWPYSAKGGKAWVMYRTLALDISEGGIWNNAVHTMRVRDAFTPSIKIKASVNHTNRSKLKIYAGISSDTTAAVPEHTLAFPLFLYQGGPYGMKGDTVNQIEFGLDITPLLTYVDPDMPVKYFLCIDENDPSDTSAGQIISFSVKDKDSNTTVSPQSNVTIINNSITYITLIRPTSFDPPEITTNSIPAAVRNDRYEQTLSASGGTSPYSWDIQLDYNEEVNTNFFPVEADSLLSVTNNDDGIGNIDLDFSFPFYGVLYDQITVSTDGSILFRGEFESIRNEGSILKTITITPYGADLMAYPEYGEGIFFYNDPEFSVVKWVTSIYDSAAVDLDFAVKLYKTGNIEFFYGQDMTTGITWASGISGGDANSAVISSLSNTNNPSGLNTSFIPDDFPAGMQLGADGVFSGTLTGSPDTWDISFRVTDDKNISSVKTLQFTLLSDLGSPSNLSVSASGSKATLTWNSVSGASVYNIYRSINPYGTFTKIGSSGSTTFEDTSISGANRYFYYIKAGNYK